MTLGEATNSFSFILRGIAVLMLMFSVLPKMYKETLIHNGIDAIRRWLFIMGVAILVVDLTSIFINICTLTQCTVYGEHSLLNYIGAIRSVGDLVSVVMLWFIYSYKYKGGEDHGH